MRKGVVVGAIVSLLGCGHSQSGLKMSETKGEIARVTVDGQDMVLVPSSVSAQRVQKLGLPQQGSEDVSHLLVPPPNLPLIRYDEDRDYRPQDPVEWVVDIEFETGKVLSSTEISNAFDRAWLDLNGRPTIFGWSPEINHWTYLVSADAPKAFTKLAIGWPLYRSYDDNYRISAADLEGFLERTQLKAANLGRPTIRTNRTPQEAENAASLIRDTVAKCDQGVVIVLKAPRGKRFDGKTVWDVMMCLQLRWGDGDLFHWQNESGFGDDMFFSVETSTPPGYFLPERIVAGTTQLDDLIFAFSIPRSAAPVAVLESMVKAATYAKARLGGEIVDRNGQPFDEFRTKRETETIVDQLRQAGFKPGEEATLHVF
jgi:cell division protein ZipA